MGKNHMIYFDEETEELAGGIEGRGTLVCELIKQHFSNDEETLRRKVEASEQEFNALTAKLNLKVKQRQDKEAKNREVKKQSKEEIERRIQLNEWKKKLEKHEITAEEYFKAFDKEGKYEAH